jgi:ATP-binding cassette subfamily B protein
VKFFSVLPRASPSLTGAWWALILLRGTLPALFSLVVAGVVAAVDEGRSLPGPLLAAGAVFVTIQVLAPLHVQVGVTLGERLARWLHDRLLAATTGPPGLAHLESRALADRLVSARDFDLGIAGPPMRLSMAIIAGSLVEVVAGLGQAVVLFAYAWWAPLLIGGAWASTHLLLKESSVWGDRDEGEVLDAQRHAEYAYRQAVDFPAAKELRLFGLSEWTVARFAANRRRLVDLRWQATRLRRKPLRRAVVVLVAANGVLLWALARDAIAGGLSTGGLSTGQIVLFAQAAVGVSALAFGGLSWALPPAEHAVTTVLALHDEMAAAGDLPAGAGDAAGTVRFRQVGFTYPGAARPVLDGLDLTIEAGRSLAVVGLNGAGKTTLAKLLCGLYQPTHGVIEAGGADLRELNPRAWRRRVTAVFQDFIRYELPLRENVAPLGAPDETIAAALADAGVNWTTELDT